MRPLDYCDEVIMTSSRPNHDYACGMFVYKGELTTHSTEAERPHMAAVNIDFKNNRRAHAYATSLKYLPRLSPLLHLHQVRRAHPLHAGSCIQSLGFDKRGGLRGMSTWTPAGLDPPATARGTVASSPGQSTGPQR